MDFRLRDASHISEQTVKLLKDLHSVLTDILTELSWDASSAENSVSSSNEDIWPEEGSTSELQQLYEEVRTIMECLYQLSMFIRKPAQHNLFVDTHYDEFARAHEEWDRSYVRDKHPSANDAVIHRLGLAISQRREHLRHWERHHAKLSQGIADAEEITGFEAETVISETIATEYVAKQTEFRDDASSSGLSQTSCATSLLEGDGATIPPLPSEWEPDKPFECPYYFFIIRIHDVRSWKRHIFRDLQPYICTFSECSTSNRLYDSRREWYSHENRSHRLDNFNCQLCQEILGSSKQRERHVGRHLEELALFPLSVNKVGDDGNQVEKGLHIYEDESEDDSQSSISTNEHENTSGTAEPASHIYEDESEIDGQNITSTNEHEREAEPPEPEQRKPLKFKDAIGRRFSFPFDLVDEWRVSPYTIFRSL